MSQFTFLTPEQTDSVRGWLAGAPRSLAEQFPREDFPRELDVYIFPIEGEMRRKWSWSREPLEEGQAFDLVRVSNLVLRALLANHDPDGVFGPPVRQKVVEPGELRLAYHDYLTLLLELRGLARELEPGLQMACDKVELAERGPSPAKCGCDRCQVSLHVVHAGQDEPSEVRTGG